MAQLAICPECSREMLIAGGTSPIARLKCPDCGACFSLQHASLREIPVALAVEQDAIATNDQPVLAGQTAPDVANRRGGFALSPVPSPTVPDLDARASLGEPDDAETELADTSIETPPDAPYVDAGTTAASSSFALATSRMEETPGSDNGRAQAGESKPADGTNDLPVLVQLAESPADTADRLERWFRAEKARLETPHLAAAPAIPSAQDHASVEDNLVAESAIELELKTPPAGNPASGDGSDHAEHLLAGAHAPAYDDDSARTKPDALPSDIEPSDLHGSTPVITSAVPADTERPPRFASSRRIRGRKKSPVRMFAGVVVAGVIGSALGYYVLMWIAGSTGDFLDIAKYLPAAILPIDLRPKNVVHTEHDARGEIQAAYTGPAEKEVPPSAVKNLRTADEDGGPVNRAGEPLEFENAGAQPLPGSNAAAGQIVNPPTFTADELAVSLRTAKDAAPNLLAGDLSDGREVQRAKGLSYSLLCDLAQKTAFVDVSSRTEYVEPLAKEAETLFQQTLADDHTRGDVARIVRKWIDSPNRKHGGVFFAGTLIGKVHKGSVVECQFKVGQEPLTVLVAPAAARQLAPPSKPWGIIGWIVDRPVEQVAGYNGDASQLIWASRLIPLQ